MLKKAIKEVLVKKAPEKTPEKKIVSEYDPNIPMNKQRHLR